MPQYHDGEPDVRERFVSVHGERVDDGEYRLKCLRKGGDYRDSGEYETIRTGWLKVEGVGFSAPAFEFSEYQTYIVVTQTNEGGGTNITFEPFEEE